jgi:hypothetical protein
MTTEKKCFDQDGYFHVEGVVTAQDLKKVEKDIFSFARLFAKKINHDTDPQEPRKSKANGKGNNKIKINNEKDFSDFCVFLEKYNPVYFFEFIRLVSKLSSVLNFVNTIVKDKLLKITSNILNEKTSNLLTSYPPAFLVNPPKNKRILYHWHNAKNGYPKRNSYVNYWIPLITDKTSKNGTLLVGDKSHHQDYPHLEYKETSKYGDVALTQNLISDKLVNKFKKITVKCKVGSCWGMHRYLLHSSSLNRSNKCSYVLVFKIWSIANDWTLSSDIEQKYFHNDPGSGKDVDIIQK